MKRISSEIIKLGLRASDSFINQQDKIWSKYSSDKVNIGETLAKVIRTLSKSYPLSRNLKALSIGSSDEPQLRILQTGFQGGLYLLDIDKNALDTIKERLKRQKTHHVYPIKKDFNRIFSSCSKTQSFLKEHLKQQRINFVTLQHSMYYCKKERWNALIKELYSHILSPKGAIYLVLMSSRSNSPSTTTWLYNHFSSKFFGHKNDQDLLAFKNELKNDPSFRKAQIVSKSSKVSFFTEDFEQFMAVVWMILLHPRVHHYTPMQQAEVIQFIYDNFFIKRKPLYQIQDHVAIYRGIPFKGII